jgi:hypothetical protein
VTTATRANRNDGIAVGMACCKRKRSENDSMRDDETGQRYCGTCWHLWMTKELAKKKRPCSTVSGNKTCPVKEPVAIQGVSDALVTGLYEDDDSVGELAAERNDDGRLQRVGFVNGTGELILDSVRGGNGDFPFEANPADHCETPFQAYADLAPALDWLAKTMGKSKSTLQIYDPYYCDGSVKKHLASLGFTACHNEREDFYARIAEDAVPSYDVLITNPPYAPTPERDHVETLLKFVMERKRPFFILQPNYVYTKTFYERAVASLDGGPRLLFLQPPLPRDYVYVTPDGFRDVKAAQRKTAPHITFWYCWLGPAIQAQFIRDYAKGCVVCPRLTLACSEFFLGDSFKDSSDKTRKRNRNKNGKRPRGS